MSLHCVYVSLCLCQLLELCPYIVCTCLSVFVSCWSYVLTLWVHVSLSLSVAAVMSLHCVYVSLCLCQLLELCPYIVCTCLSVFVSWWSYVLTLYVRVSLSWSVAGAAGHQEATYSEWHSSEGCLQHHGVRPRSWQVSHLRYVLDRGPFKCYVTLFLDIVHTTIITLTRDLLRLDRTMNLLCH